MGAVIPLKSAPEELPWSYIALALVPIAAFFACELLVALLAQRPDIYAPNELTPLALPAGSAVGSDTIPPGSLDVSSADGEKCSGSLCWPEASARIQLLSMVPLYLAAALAVIVKFAADLFLFLEPTRWRIGTAYCLCVVAGALVW
jgi:hypothetical protein